MATPVVEAFEKGIPTKIRFLDSTSQTIEITAPANKKVVIEEIFVDGAKWFDIYVQNRLIGRFPAALGDCKFVPKPGEVAPSYGLFNLIRQIIGPKYIVAYPDEKITITFDAAPSKAVIVYHEIPAEESMGEEVRGVEDYMIWFNIVTHSASIGASGTYTLDTVKAPTGALMLKSGDRVPTGYEIELKAIAFGAASAGDTKPTYLHLWVSDQKILVPAPDKAVLVDPAYNTLKFDIVNRLGFILKEEYKLVPGQMLTMQFDAVYDGTNTLAAESCYLIMFGILKRIK